MRSKSTQFLGVLPSLEVLPLFTEAFDRGLAHDDCPIQIKSYSSYGEISRRLLTRQILGGIVPWEIFIADILALPGQRACWKIPLFLQACPPELVLRESVYRAFYPSQVGTPAKPPQRLSIGIENQNSLTKVQLQDWLGHWKTADTTRLKFTMLPMETRIEALRTGSLDGIIARTPWGLHAESNGLGKRDPRFSPTRCYQKLVLVCHRDGLEQHPNVGARLAQSIAEARVQLNESASFTKAINNLSLCGKPVLPAEILERAADLYSFLSLTNDVIPDLKKLVSELMNLDTLAILPREVSPTEQTAHLLLSA